jgi:hypothetical protein
MSARPTIGLACLVAVVAVGLASVPSGEAAKAHRCKPGQIRVKVGKHKVCRRARAVFPAARKGDPRVLFMKAALARVHGHARARRKAVRAMLRALPKALARIDELAPGRKPLARATAVDCSAPIPGSGKRQFSDGGVTFKTTLGHGGTAITISYKAAGYEFFVHYFTTDGCDDLSPPRCPSASGAADAKGSRLDKALIEVSKDGAVLSHDSTSVRRTTQTHGQVAADAKLDFVDVDDVVHISSASAGTAAVSGTITRHLHINMRTGKYDPSQSTASFAGAQALQTSDRGSFAGLAAGIIGIYRSAESNPGRIGFGAGWSVFDRPDGGNYCISAKYSPDISTLKLKKGDTGTFVAKAIASDGGVAADAIWNPKAQFNGAFSPARPRGGTTSVFYRVTGGGHNERITITYRITSTAGVDESTWSQDAEDDTTIKHITGSFSGDETLATSLGRPSVFAVRNGSVTFTRASPAPFGGADGSYRATSGGYTVVASGPDSSGLTGCDQTGSKTFRVAAGTLFASGTGVTLTPPYRYTFDVQPPSSPPPSMTITRINCPSSVPPELGNGTTFVGGLGAPISTVQTHSSPDGKTFAGSEDQTIGGSGFSMSWSFRGTTD